MHVTREPSILYFETPVALLITLNEDGTPDKGACGFRHEKHKFEVPDLTPVKSEVVAPPRVRKCPVQLEAIHVDEAIVMDGNPHRIDPDRWRPLLFSFQQFYGLGAKVAPSTLGQIPEEMYRTPDMVGGR